MSSTRSARAVFRQPWPASFYSTFTHYLTKGTILGEKVIEHKFCVLIFLTTFSETVLTTRIQQKVIINAHCSARKLQAILVRLE